MAKRFTETNKWNDGWFWRLPPTVKILWLYILDNCDHAGIWELDLDLFEQRTGIKVSLSEWSASIAPKAFRVKGAKVWIRGFVDFQYGELSVKSKPHLSVIATLKKNGLWEEYLKGMDTLKDKEQDQDKDKEQEGKGMQGENQTPAPEPVTQPNPQAADMALAASVVDAYPDMAPLDRRPIQKGIHAPSLALAAIRKRPDHPWVEHATLVRELVEAPHNLEKWLREFSDMASLEALRKLKIEKDNGGPKNGAATQRHQPTRQQQLGAASRKMVEGLRRLAGEGEAPDRQDVGGGEPSAPGRTGMAGGAGQGMPATLEGHPVGNVGRGGQ